MSPAFFTKLATTHNTVGNAIVSKFSKTFLGKFPFLSILYQNFQTLGQIDRAHCFRDPLLLFFYPLFFRLNGIESILKFLCQKSRIFEDFEFIGPTSKLSNCCLLIYSPFFSFIINAQICVIMPLISTIEINKWLDDCISNLQPTFKTLSPATYLLDRFVHPLRSV